jgi:hypothetical protein
MLSLLHSVAQAQSTIRQKSGSLRTLKRRTLDYLDGLGAPSRLLEHPTEPGSTLTVVPRASEVSCPVCGDASQVKTLAEVFALLVCPVRGCPGCGIQEAQRLADTPHQESAPDWLTNDQSPRSADPDQQVADVAVAAAGRFLG